MERKKERYNSIPVEASIDHWKTLFYGLLGYKGLVFYNGSNGGRFDHKDIINGNVEIRPILTDQEKLFASYMEILTHKND